MQPTRYAQMVGPSKQVIYQCSDPWFDSPSIPRKLRFNSRAAEAADKNTDAAQARVTRELNVENPVDPNSFAMVNITIAIALATCMVESTIPNPVMLHIAIVTDNSLWGQVDSLGHPKAKDSSVWPFPSAKIQHSLIKTMPLKVNYLRLV